MTAKGRGGIGGAERFFDSLPRIGNVTATETPLGVVRSTELQGGGTASIRPFSQTNPSGVDGNIQFISEKYNFEPHDISQHSSWMGMAARNVETYFGFYRASKAGTSVGVDYKINFSDSPTLRGSR